MDHVLSNEQNCTSLKREFDCLKNSDGICSDTRFWKERRTEKEEGVYSALLQLAYICSG